MATFLSVEEYKAYSGGGDITPPGGDAELYHTIETASGLLNELAQGWLQYHTVTDEEHKVRADPQTGALYFRLRQKPVRQVVGMTLLVGAYGGGRSGLGFSTTPSENLPAPVIQGNVIVNRESSSLRVTGPQVFYAPPGVLTLWNAPVGITYTVGYDDGTVQADGLSFPAPGWVKEATRLTTRKLLIDAARARSGRVAAGSYTIGDVSETYKNDADGALPEHVSEMVQRNMQHWVLGSQ